MTGTGGVSSPDAPFCNELWMAATHSREALVPVLTVYTHILCLSKGNIPLHGFNQMTQIYFASLMALRLPKSFWRDEKWDLKCN